MKIDNRIIIGIFVLIFCVSITHGLYMGNIYFDGENATGGNLFLPAYISTSCDCVQQVASAGIWYNLSYNVTYAQNNIGHNDSADQDIFICNDAGAYHVNWHISIRDTAVNPAGHVVTRLAKNGVEVQNSVFEKNTYRQDETISIHHKTLVVCDAGDILKLQFTGDATTIETYTPCTYGDSCVAKAVVIERIA